MSAITVNNRTYSDDSDPVTGLGNGGHRTRLLPLFNDALTEIAQQVLTASQSYRATSLSTASIGSGLKDFVITAGKGFAVGDRVVARQSANAANFMVGAISAFDAATGGLTLSVAPGDFGGSGVISDWDILGPIGPRGLRGLAGYSYRWDVSAVAGDPGPGLMRANNTALPSATALYLDNLDGLGVDAAAQLAQWGASTSAVKGRLLLRSQTDSSQQISYDVTAVAASAGHCTLTVVHRGGGAAFAAGAAVDVAFSRTGDKGDVANPGQQVQFDAATAAADPGPGKIRFNNAALSSATAAFIDVVDANGANIAAWLSALGAGSNPQKGVLRVQSMATLTKFAEFGVSAAVASSGYHTLTLSYLSPTPAPVFAAGEPLALLWSRAGDKGDTGAAGSIANAGDGTATAPGFAFSSETGLGIRRKGAALAAVTGGGADLLELRPATLAEAQAGTNALAVMTPQRVAHAITALATAAVLPAQAGQAGKVLRTDGSAANWAFQSGSGGAEVTGSVVLTASSAAAQAVTPTAQGQAVTLPNATTLGSGAQIYQISNRSDKFQLGIRDATGKLIEVIAPGGVCDLGLIDVSSTAGRWTANNSAPESLLITATIARSAVYGSDPSLSWATVGTSRLYLLGATDLSTGLYLQAFDSSTNQLGAPVLVTATVGSGLRGAKLTGLSANAALLVYQTSLGDLRAVVATVSGSAVSLGTIATASASGLFPGFSSASFGIVELQSLSATSAIALFLWQNGGPQYFYSALAVSVSGATVTIGGTRRDIMAGSVVVTGARSMALPLVALTATTAALMYLDTLGSTPASAAGLVITVSGASLTLGSPSAVTLDPNNGGFLFARQLATGKYVIGYRNISAQLSFRTLTFAGTTVTVGAELNSFTSFDPASGQAVVYDATRLLYLSAVGYGLLQESAGALSIIVPPVTASTINFVNPPLGAPIAVIDGAVYFAQSRSVARLQFDGVATLSYDALLEPPRNGNLPNALFAKIGTTALFTNLAALKGRNLLGLGAAQLTGAPTALTALGGARVAFWTVSPLTGAYSIHVAEVAQ